MTPRDPIFIVAEMAWSHNGSVEHAVAMVRGAQAAGADAIGIHFTSLPDYLVRTYRGRAGATISDTGSAPADSIYDYLTRINLGPEQWRDVVAVAREVGLQIVNMPNDAPSVDLAEALAAADYYVIAAACFTEYSLVRRLAATGLPLILRIGGATLAEIETVITIAREEGAKDITLLHGIQLYPTPIAQLNLSALASLASAFGCAIGLADHVDGSLPEAITLPALAIPYGVTMIEKHITVDRDLKLEDYEAALGINEFPVFVRYVRTAEAALGDGEPGAETDGDRLYRSVARKKIVARHPIAAGAAISMEDIAYKRSDAGLEIEYSPVIIGRRATRAIAADEGITLDDCAAP